MKILHLENERRKLADPVQGEVRGRVRSARMAWTDPESGQRLTVDLQGSEGFLSSLEREGFEPIAGAPELDKPRGFLDSVRRVWSARVQMAPRRTQATNRKPA